MFVCLCVCVLYWCRGTSPCKVICSRPYFTYTDTERQTHTQTHTHTHTHLCIHTYIHTYILTCINTYIHTYIHTCCPAWSSVLSWSVNEHDRQGTYERNFEALSCNHCCSGREISTTCSVCVSVVLTIQHAKRVHRVVLSSMACTALHNFTSLSYKRYDFRKHLLNRKCLFWLPVQLSPETYFILRRIQNVHRFSCKLPALFVRL